MKVRKTASVYFALQGIAVIAWWCLLMFVPRSRVFFQMGSNENILYIRNPMALSGIGQGIAVALFLGSPLVLIYAIMGSLIWQLVFRPLEEGDLRKRFGKDYEDYCEKVKCWVPNVKAYDPAENRL